MKISIGKVELILTKEDPNPASGLPFLFYKAENEDELISLVRFLQSEEAKAVSKVYVLVRDTNQAMDILKKKLQFVIAAGGIVEFENKTLWIKRLGRWDLPKGKVEKGEDFERTARREIEEETGVKAKIKQFLCSTFHTYQIGEKLYLKETKWYHLEANSLKKAFPQTEEGITEAVWKEQHQIPAMLQQSYLSIELVYAAFLKKR